MIMKPDFSVVMPSFNEEGSLEATCQSFLAKLEQTCGAHEIIIVDDGSSDRTPEIADRLAGNHPGIKTYHNDVNRGLGYSLRRGMEAATKEYVMFWAPGCDMENSSFKNLIAHIGKADMIISYIANPGYRSMTRRIISRGYTLLVNALFDLHLPYYNGATIYPTKQIQQLFSKNQILSEGYVFMAEVLIRMIKSGLTHIEVPVQTIHITGASTELGLIRKGTPTLRSIFQVYRALR